MKIAVVANIRKEGARTIVPRFAALLEIEGISCVLQEDLRDMVGAGAVYAQSERLFEGVDYIVSFGGDGTMLNTARLSQGTGIPILGVNLGKVGFLAEVAPEEIDLIPDKLKSGDLEIIDRMAFDIDTSHDKKFFALNDIVLDRNIDTRILTLTVTVDGQYAGEFHADGLIAATPTGSTAHSMAAGGPLVMPECSVIILSPICPHSLTIRPMIIDGSKTVGIGVAEGFARMAVDGQSFISVPAGCEVTIKKAAYPVRVARFKDKTYFDILHTRLRWGVSLKLKNA